MGSNFRALENYFKKLISENSFKKYIIFSLSYLDSTWTEFQFHH